MASTLGSTSREIKVLADSTIQRCSSSACSTVKILSAVSLIGVVRKAVPASVGFIVVDMCSFFSLFLMNCNNQSRSCHSERSEESQVNDRFFAALRMTAMIDSGCQHSSQVA